MIPRSFYRSAQRCVEGAKVKSLERQICSNRQFSSIGSIKTSRYSPLPTISASSRPRAPHATYGFSTTLIKRFSAATKLYANQSPGHGTPSAKSTEFAEEAVDPLVQDYSNLSNFQESLGYLKDMGLDYGWGPTSMIQFLFEQLHVSIGLPWWGVIVVASVLIRIASFPASVIAVETQTRRLYIKHLTDPLKAKLKSAPDTSEKAKISQEINSMNKDAGASLWKSFVPVLIQLPLGFGLFRLVRGMSMVPIPSLQTEGALWFTDLTVADPTGILPVTAGLTSYALGKYMSTIQDQGPDTQAMRTILTYGLPIIIIGITLFQPAAFPLMIFLGTLGQMITTKMLHKTWVRNLLNMTRPPPSRPPPSVVTSKSQRQPARVVDAGAPLVPAHQDSKLPPSTSPPANIFRRVWSTCLEARDSISKWTENSRAQYRGEVPGKKTKAQTNKEQNYEMKRAKEDEELLRKINAKAKAQRLRQQRQKHM